MLALRPGCQTLAAGAWAAPAPAACLPPPATGLNPAPLKPPPPPPPRSVRLEQQIESDYRGALQQQCYNERMLQVRPGAVQGAGAACQGRLALLLL